MSADRRDPRPRHQQVAADLRAAILSGQLPPGTELPSTARLATQYDAAPATIQAAQATLRAEGLLDSRAGKAVWVRADTRLVTAAPYLGPGDGGWSYDLLRVDEVTPPAEVAAALRLTDGGTAILRHRLMRHHGDPVELSWSYYPADLARSTPLARRAKIRGGAPAVLAALGAPQHRMTDHITARPPTTEELLALNLSGETPVLRQFRVLYSTDDRPVEAAILIKGTHRHVLAYDQQLP